MLGRCTIRHTADGIHHPFTATALVIQSLDDLYQLWQQGVMHLEDGLAGLEATHVIEEIANANVCGAVFRSTRNLYKLYQLCLVWEEQNRLIFNGITEDELDNLKHVLPYVAADRRFGYHSEPQDYMFDADSIRSKSQVLESYVSH
jgi:hypothetical protein